MEDYKVDIQNTRKGCLGSSDAKMLQKISILGLVPQSAYKRMAVCKGFIENTDIPHTDAVKFGDAVEQAIFSYLSETQMGYVSNPLWVSTKYSRKNVRCISHPDMVRQDDANKILYVYEVKASKYNTTHVRTEYESQLYNHWLLANERAKELGDGWKVKLYLVHYSTNGLDLSQPQEFNIDRINIRQVQFGKKNIYDLSKAMDIVNDFLEGFNEYYDKDEINAEYLPEVARKKFDMAIECIKEIKEREEKINEFKEKLYEFLMSKGIKKVSCDMFTFSVVEPSKQVTTDYKKIFENEIASKHPYKARRLCERFKKVTEKRGFVQIRIKDNK